MNFNAAKPNNKRTKYTIRQKHYQKEQKPKIKIEKQNTLKYYNMYLAVKQQLFNKKKTFKNKRQTANSKKKPKNHKYDYH